MNSLRSHADTLDHLERAIADRDHHRALYRATFGLACDALVENARLSRMVSEMREERCRYAKQLFGWTAAQATGEES